MAAVSSAQGSHGDTVISYDDLTGTVMASGDTTNDLDNDYESQARLWVYDQNGVTVASGFDSQPYDNASVSLSFAATPGSTYTAVTQHCFHLQSWDNDSVYPYQLYYYDNWNMYSFVGQNIYTPLDYFFASPGYGIYHRPTNFFCVGRTYDSVAVPPILVDINIPSQADDGSSVFFYGTVSGATPTGYQWSFTTSTGAGNNPDLNFTSATSVSTFATSKWFANPDSACSASGSSTYAVKLTVTFSSRSPISTQKSFTVNVPWNPAGQVDPNVARVTGAPQQCVDGNGVWYVCGMGNLGRLTPSKQIFVSSSSQFYSKTVAHEQEHENHWMVGNLLGNLHNPADFYARIQNFTGTSQQDLINKLSAELTAYTNEQGVLYSNLRAESERRAFLVSDPLSPQYYYQNCGRYP